MGVTIADIPVPRYLTPISIAPSEHSAMPLGILMPPSQRLDLNRTAIIGNTASGKSWLAKQLGQDLSLTVVDLDQIRWVGGDFSRKETTARAIAKTAAMAKQEKWIIEGVYDWLISPIIDRVTCLIWTDIPFSESRRNLASREAARGTSGNFKELEAWSGEYWERTSGSSFGAHLAIYETFGGRKYRLKDMAETSDFLASIARL